MEIGNHVKIKWSIRGDYSRTAADAWDKGIEVSLPNYSYGSARYDRESEIILLSNGDRVSTAIRRYEHTEVIPAEEVECSRCGKLFQGHRRCPGCDAADW